MNRFSRVLAASALAIPLAFAAGQANAFLVFSGEDLNNSATVPLAAFPNSTGAQTSFLSNLVGVGTENFEGFAAGSTAPLALNFAGAGTATLSGGGGSVRSTAAGTTNGVGRYGTSPTNYWNVAAGGSGNFQVALSSPVAAFGFFGIDIGDFGGQLELELTTAGGLVSLIVPNTVGSNGSTDGTVLFFGLIAENASEEFTNVSFLTTTGGGDVFAFDDLTIGSAAQVQIPVPEPGSLAMFAIGLLALGFFGRTRRFNQRS